MTDDLSLFLALVRVETLWYEQLSDEVQAAHGLPLSSYDVLQVIDSVEGCRVQDISREIGITVGAVSKSVDRLEQSGWVRRRANPSDRRSSLIELTASGARLVAEVAPLVASSLHERLGALDRAERAALSGALAKLRAGFETAPAR